MLEGRAMIKEISNKSVVVLTSGGLDSSTTMLRLANEGYRVYPLFINYGQDALFMEWGSIKSIVRILQKRNMAITDRERIDIDSIDKFHQNRRKTGIKNSIFPFRNLILVSIGAFYGYHLNIFELALGLVKDGFPDCTSSFQSKLEEVLSESVSKKISVIAPFIDQHKSDIVEYGNKHDFPYKETYSCYEGGNDHCGKCGGCEGRKRAFKEAGIDDPTKYKN